MEPIEEKKSCHRDITVKRWLNEMKDPNLHWEFYNTAEPPLDVENPTIDITVPNFKGRSGFEKRWVTIQSQDGKVTLFQSPVINGLVQGRGDALRLQPGSVDGEGGGVGRLQGQSRKPLRGS